MKLDDKIVTQGVFAIGEQTTCPIAGSLEINEMGKISLDCIHSMGMQDINAVNLTGETSELGKVILLDCYSVSASHTFAREFTRHKFICNTLACVNKNHTGYDLKSKKMTFEIEDMEKWLAKKIVENEFDSKITYAVPKNETIELGNGLLLTFKYVVNISTGNFHESSKVSGRVLAVFENNDEMPIGFYIEKAITLSNLVSFSLDSVCTIKKSFYGDNDQNKVYHSTSNHHRKKKEINLVNYIFTLKNAGDRRCELVKNWFSIADKIRPTISLYNQFKSKNYKYYDAAFLSLSQAVEALHRRTCDDKPMEKADYTKKVNEIIEKAGDSHRDFLERKLSSGNEYSFRLRVELMLKVCWSEEKIEHNRQIITKVINARNFLTHYPESKEPQFYKSFNVESEEYVSLLENIIISYILFLISNDNAWVMAIMNRRSQFTYTDF